MQSSSGTVEKSRISKEITHNHPEDKWQQTIGLGGALAIVVGSILGIGVFLTPHIVAQHVPNTTWFILVWAVGGLMALAGAFVYAELGSMFPMAGGDYVFLKEAYGKPLAFLSGWICLAATFSGSIAATAVGLAQYYIGPSIGESFFTPFFTLGFIKISYLTLASVALIVTFTGLNIVGISFSTVVQGFISFTPMVILVLAAIWAMTSTSGTSVSSVTPAGASSGVSGVSLVPLGVAILPVFFAYSGWSSAAYIGSEIKNAKRTLPLSLIIGIGMIIVLYMLLNLLFIKGESVASLRNMPNMMEAAALKSFGPVGVPIFTTLVAVAIMGTLNSTILTGPRIYHTMANDRMLFKSVGQLSPRFGTPAKGLIIQGTIAIAYVILGGFEAILNYTSMMIVIFSGITVFGLILLRKRGHRVEGQFRAPLFPLFPAIYLIMSVFLLVTIAISNPVQIISAVAICLAGLVFYYVFTHKKVAAHK
ncbi:MAG: amino acid permease [Deltaproteobacteria bacterium]|nr:amino acid permease [Deltaproteobacteria bacterium]